MATQIGPYEVVRPLGAGGMAETYEAVRRGPDGFVQRVCLKRILPAFSRDAEFTRQFSSEARIAAALRHANIVQVLDFGEFEGSYFQALELVQGLDLRELLAREGALSSELVLHCGMELATALDYAHRASVGEQVGGVVHRDISPSNVLLSLEGEVKLADFGIARPLQGPKHTASGIIKGKIAYLAPEYARTGRFDGRADLFALGVVLFECLSGQRPYDAPTDFEILRRASEGEHPSLASLVPQAPGALVALVEQLIRPDPGDRVQSASGVLDALLLAHPPSDGRRRLSTLVRRHTQRAGPSGTQAARAGDTVLLATPAGAGDSPAGAGDASTTRTALSTYASGRIAVRSRRRALVLAVVACLAGAALGGLGLRWLSASGKDPTASGALGAEAPPRHRPERAAETEGPSRTATDSASVDAGLREVVLHDPRELPSRTEEEGPAPAETALSLARTEDEGAGLDRAQLTIVVVPFGEVAVDGRNLGAAPVSVTLRAGVHRVRAFGPAVEAERQVSLSAGERRRVVLR